MSFFDLFKSSTKSVENITDIAKMGANGIDALFYTEQEKAEFGLKSAELKIKIGNSIAGFVEATKNESTIRSITRRYMAWAIVINAILLTWCSILFAGLSLHWESFAGVSELTYNFFLKWSGANIAVVSFYFGYYAISNVVDRIKK